MAPATTDYPSTLSLQCGPVAAIDLALFAAASGDHNPLHLDADAARSAGFDQPLVHGMLTMAYAARMLTRHFGPGSVQRLDTRFTGTARKGDVLQVRAQLLAVETGSARYALTVSTDDGAGVVTGSAQVRQTRPRNP